MSKKKDVQVPRAEDMTTPEQLADLWVKLQRAKKDVATEIEVVETALRGHVEETGADRIGVLTVYSKAKPAALVCTNEKLDLARQKDALMEELMDSEYIKRSLDVTGIHKAAPYEKFLERALTKYKLATVQETENYFKAP
jgi:hypothetical protein